MTFAFSVHSFVDKIGAYVGFAAAIGLALFALLLFAQARELKRLREWGEHAHDRIGELERRLAAALELARRASTSQRTMPPGAVAQRPVPARPAAPARATPAMARTSSPTRLPLLPAAPARVAGAALGSATAFVPLPKQPPAPVSPGTPAPVPAAPATAVPAAVPAVAAAATAAATPAPATAAGQAPAQPAVPSPAAPAPTPQPPAATNGHSDTFPPVPPVRRPAPRPGARPAPGRRVPPRAPARPAAAPLRARSAPSASPRGNGTVEAPHGRRRLTLLLGGLGAVAVVAIAFVLLSGGSDSPSLPAASNTAPTQPTTAGSRQTTPVAAPAHGRVTVAVLNGTPTPGLASTVATALTSDGFVQGPVGNASDQQRSVTVVSYFGGHEAEAQEVAKTLNVPADAVQPIDADTEAACASGATCTATVVVTVGADRQ